MSTEFALDLKAARRKAGFTQGDIAHLIGHQQSRVSDLELGHDRPTLEQTVLLSLIYGRSFESLFSEVMAECRAHLTTRLSSLPPSGVGTASTHNRVISLRKLQQRLAASDRSDGNA